MPIALARSNWLIACISWLLQGAPCTCSTTDSSAFCVPGGCRTSTASCGGTLNISKGSLSKTKSGSFNTSGSSSKPRTMESSPTVKASATGMARQSKQFAQKAFKCSAVQRRAKSRTSTRTFVQATRTSSPPSETSTSWKRCTTTQLRRPSLGSLMCAAGREVRISVLASGLESRTEQKTEP